MIRLDVDVLAQVLEESGVASMTLWWDDKEQKQHIEFDWHEHAMRIIAAYETRMLDRLAVCPTCGTSGPHTVMGHDYMPDHRWPEP